MHIVRSLHPCRHECCKKIWSFVDYCNLNRSFSKWNFTMYSFKVLFYKNWMHKLKFNYGINLTDTSSKLCMWPHYYLNRCSFTSCTSNTLLASKWLWLAANKDALLRWPASLCFDCGTREWSKHLPWNLLSSRLAPGFYSIHWKLIGSGIQAPSTDVQ